MNKILAQAAPAAATSVTLYEVPIQSAADVKSLFICNRAGATTFRVALVPDGETLADKHYIYYDTALAANETLAEDTPIFLEEGDSIRIESGSGTVSFTVSGDEFKP